MKPLFLCLHVLSNSSHFTMHVCHDLQLDRYNYYYYSNSSKIQNTPVEFSKQVRKREREIQNGYLIRQIHGGGRIYSALPFSFPVPFDSGGPVPLYMNNSKRTYDIMCVLVWLETGSQLFRSFVLSIWYANLPSSCPFWPS